MAQTATQPDSNIVTLKSPLPDQTPTLCCTPIPPATPASGTQATPGSNSSGRVSDTTLRTPAPLSPAAVIGFGDASLDALLGGGVPCRALTELCGESSSGKTQLALQLCLRVQLPVAMGGLAGRT